MTDRETTPSQAIAALQREVDELRQLVAGLVEELKHDRQLAFDMDEATALLNLPATWLRHAVTARQVAHRRIGRHVRFTRDDLDQILADAAQPVESAPVAPLAPRRRSA